MALTSISTSDNDAVKVWHKGLEREVIRNLFFSKFMSKGIDSPVLMLNDLQGNPGDTIHYQLLKALTGDGITSGTLEGKEEEESYYDDTITLKMRAHAVSDAGPLSNQRTTFNVTKEAAELLKTWLAEKIDDDMFLSLRTSLTKSIYVDSSGDIAGDTGANAKADIGASTSNITPQQVRYARTWAKTGNNGSQPRIKPCYTGEGGKKRYIAVMYPDIAEDMRDNSEWQQAMRDAGPRGENNKLFTDSLGVMSDIMFVDNEGVSYFTNGGGASVRGSHNLLLGRAALAFGWAKKPTVTEGSSKYGLQNGKAIHALYGVTKCVFNSKDYGVVGLTSSMTNISGL